MTLFSLLFALDKYRVHYKLGRHRDDSVMVEVAVPGEQWEVEFFENGAVEVEVFRSSEGVEGLEELERLLRNCSE